ncbi:MAG: sigma-70 family RNA polymerase sigma factor [Puia sp.]|nr:sigma-70 family RNA polymerase sigma factor [Puia sp.]
MNNYDYRTILKYIQDKDPVGLELLYERYARPFARFGVDKWKMDEDDAWDIVYKTLQTLVLKLSNYDFVSQAKFDSFLFKVYGNFLRQRLRELRSKNIPELDFFDLEEENYLPSHVREALSKQAFSSFYASEISESPLIRELRTALETLPQIDQELLLLRAQNYSYDQIADLLGVENNQLKVKYHRAKEKLLKQLNETK